MELVKLIMNLLHNIRGYLESITGFSLRVTWDHQKIPSLFIQVPMLIQINKGEKFHKKLQENLNNYDKTFECSLSREFP